MRKDGVKSHLDEEAWQVVDWFTHCFRVLFILLFLQTQTPTRLLRKCWPSMLLLSSPTSSCRGNSAWRKRPRTTRLQETRESPPSSHPHVITISHFTGTPPSFKINKKKTRFQAWKVSWVFTTLTKLIRRLWSSSPGFDSWASEMWHVMASEGLHGQVEPQWRQRRWCVTSRGPIWFFFLLLCSDRLRQAAAGSKPSAATRPASRCICSAGSWPGSRNFFSAGRLRKKFLSSHWNIKESELSLCKLEFFFYVQGLFTWCLGVKKKKRHLMTTLANAVADIWW